MLLETCARLHRCTALHCAALRCTALHCAARHCTASPCCLLPSRPIPSRARTDATSAACCVCVCRWSGISGRMPRAWTRRARRNFCRSSRAAIGCQSAAAKICASSSRNMGRIRHGAFVRSCASQSPDINTRAPVSPVDFECVHLSSLRAAAGAGAGAAPGYPRHTHASTTCFYRSTNRWSN